MAFAPLSANVYRASRQQQLRKAEKESMYTYYDQQNAPPGRMIPAVREVPPRSPPKMLKVAATGTPPKKATKKNVKPSSLCYTPPAFIRDKKKGTEYARSGLLGEGGFARCFEVCDEDGRQYAAKVVAKASLDTPKTKSKLLGEMKVHQSMSHPNIVNFVDCFEDDTNVYFILEMCSNRTLMDMLRKRKRFTEPEARYYLLQLLGACKYMHGRRVIHRDLKLGNLFLDANMNLKVGDFGLAALLVSDDERKKTICGTPNYIAPEVLFHSGSAGEGHSFEADLWSVGVILYAMLVGKPPFQSKDVKAIYRKIKANQYEFPEENPISPEARHLIESLLTPDPTDRPSLDEIADHVWFHMGIMPRSIPVEATEVEPAWKEMSSARARANWLAVAQEAGVGPNSGNGDKVAREAGKSVSMVKLESMGVEGTPIKEEERILPAEMSPRNPPGSLRKNTAKIAAAHMATSRALRTGLNLRPERMVATGPFSEDDDEEKEVKTMTRSTRRLNLDVPLRGPKKPVSGPFSEEDPMEEVRVKAEQREPRKMGTLGAPARAPGLGAPTRPGTRSTSRMSAAPVPSQRAVSPPMPVPAEREPIVKTESTGMRLIAENLSMAYQSNGDNLPPSFHVVSQEKPLFITKWVDFSDKYGLGYQLLNSSYGVYWNDSTTIILAADEYHFDYIRQNAVYDQDPALLPRENFDLDHFPKQDDDLAKKVSLLAHFRSYMTQLLKKSEMTWREQQQITGMPFLQNYLRARQAILFRLSNGDVQCNFFQDHSKMLLSDNGRTLRYISGRNSGHYTWSVAEAMKQKDCPEVPRYIKFISETLLKWDEQSKKVAGAGQR